MTTTVDSEAIIQARIRGYSARAIAKHLGCTVADVTDALDNFARLTLTKNLRTHTLALELERLDEFSAPLKSRPGTATSRRPC
jgi:hypothetical protein